MRAIVRSAACSANGTSGRYALLLVLLVRAGAARLAAAGPAPGLWAPRWAGAGAWLGLSILAFEGVNTAQFVYRAMRDEALFLRAVALL